MTNSAPHPVALRAANGARGRARPRLLTVGFLAALAFLLPAWAKAGEESDTAVRLRQMLSAWMLDLADAIGHDGFHHVVDVTEDGGGTIVAAIRHLSFDMAGRLGRQPDIRWDVGDVVATFTPIDRGRYRVSWDLPARTAVFDRKGNRIGGTVIGGQSASGIYIPSIGFSTQFDGAWSDATAWLDIPERESLRLQVANIDFNRMYRELGDGRWDGRDSLGLRGASVTVDGQEAVRLDSLGFDASATALDLASLNEMTELLERERLRPGDGHDDEDALAAQVHGRMLTPMLRHAPLVGRFGLAMTVNGLSAQDPDDSSRSLSLAEMRFALDAQGLDGNQASLAIEYRANALETALVPEPEAHFVPRDLAVHLVFDGLPAMDAATMILNMVESGALDPEPSKEAVFDFVASSLQRRMVQQASSFQIRKLAYGGPLLDATATGEIVASAASPAMAVGSVRLEIVGLERLMRRLKAAASDEETLELVRGLALMQAMGVRSEDEGGARHLYDLALADDGRILLNGNDVGVLMRALAGP